MDGGYAIEYGGDYGYGDFGSGESGGLNCSEDNEKFFNEMRTLYTPSMIVVPSIYCVICLIGLIGNGLVSIL